MKHISIMNKHLVCYLGTGGGITVLSEHTAWTDAFAEIEGRDFKNSSLEGSPLYIIGTTKIEVSEKE